VSVLCQIKLKLALHEHKNHRESPMTPRPLLL